MCLGVEDREDWALKKANQRGVTVAGREKMVFVGWGRTGLYFVPVLSFRGL